MGLDLEIDLQNQWEPGVYYEHADLRKLAQYLETYPFEPSRFSVIQKVGAMPRDMCVHVYSLHSVPSEPAEK